MCFSFLILRPTFARYEVVGIAGLKVQNFQLHTEPIRLFDISCFASIVKGELVVLQQ